MFRKINLAAQTAETELAELILHAAHLPEAIASDQNKYIIASLKLIAAKMIENAAISDEIALIRILNKYLNLPKEYSRKTILHLAALSNNLDLLDWLLFRDTDCQTCIDINVQDEKGKTPLRHAVDNAIEKKSEKALQAIAILLRHGADPAIADNNGITPLLFALTKADNIQFLDRVMCKLLKSILSDTYAAFGHISQESKVDLHVDFQSRTLADNLEEAEKYLIGFNALLLAAMSKQVSTAVFSQLLNQPRARELLNTPFLVANDVHVNEEDINIVDFYKKTHVTILYLAVKNQQDHKVLTLLSTPGIDHTTGKTICIPNPRKANESLVIENESAYEIANKNQDHELANLLKCYGDLKNNINLFTTNLLTQLCDLYSKKTVILALSCLVENGSILLENLRKLFPSTLSNQDENKNEETKHLIELAIKLDKVELLQYLFCIYPCSANNQLRNSTSLCQIAEMCHATRAFIFLNIHSSFLELFAKGVTDEHIKYLSEEHFIYLDKVIECVKIQNNASTEKMVDVFMKSALHDNQKLMLRLLKSGYLPSIYSTYFEETKKNHPKIKDFVQRYEFVNRVIKGEIDITNLTKLAKMTVPTKFDQLLRYFVKSILGKDNDHSFIFYTTNITSALLYHAVANNNPDLLREMLAIPHVNIHIRDKNNLTPIMLAANTSPACLAILSAYELICDSAALQNEIFTFENTTTQVENELLETDQDHMKVALSYAHPLPQKEFIATGISAAISAMISQYNYFSPLTDSKVYQIIDGLFFNPLQKGDGGSFDLARTHLTSLCYSVFLYDAIKQHNGPVMRQLLCAKEVDPLLLIEKNKSAFTLMRRYENRDMYVSFFCFLIMNANDHEKSIAEFGFNDIPIPAGSYANTITQASEQYIFEDVNKQAASLESMLEKSKNTAFTLTQSLISIALKNKLSNGLNELLGVAVIPSQEYLPVYSKRVSNNISLASDKMPSAVPLLSCYYLMEAYILKLSVKFEINNIDNQMIRDAFTLLTSKYKKSHSSEISSLLQKWLAYKTPEKFFQALASFLLNPNIANNHVEPNKTNPIQASKFNKK